MKWISVNDELPSLDTSVLWIREDGIIFIDEIDHDNDWVNFKKCWETDGFLDGEIKITHWVPLPEPPK